MTFPDPIAFDIGEHFFVSYIAACSCTAQPFIGSMKVEGIGLVIASSLTSKRLLQSRHPR